MWKHLLQAVAVVAVGIALCGFGSRLAPPDASYIMAVLYAILYLSGVLWFAIARLRSSLLKHRTKWTYRMIWNRRTRSIQNK